MTQHLPGLHVRRIGEAEAYEAANHSGIRSLRLQGLDAGGPEAFWIGLSYILPGGRAGPDAGATEKVYVVMDGELTLRAAGQERRIGRLDSVHIAAHTEREIVNDTNEMVTMLVVIPRAPAP